MKKLSAILILTFLLSACAAAAPVADTPIPLSDTPIPLTETLPATQVPSQADATPLPIADAQPQALQFASTDGEMLDGTFYPAAQPSAPLVILMHWAPGDQGEWSAIAPWLQNRGLAKKSGSSPWKDPTWFPALPEGRSYAVFTFTFRGCQGGCADFTRSKWLQDAYAAMQYAITLPGVDPQRVVTIGASIGSDGALDGCLWLNEQGLGRCRGALSFSPGDYLTLLYGTTAKKLMEGGTPAWCFYAENDSPSAQSCGAARGELYQAFKYSGGDHGMKLFRQSAQPDPLEKILEFLDANLQ